LRHASIVSQIFLFGSDIVEGDTRVPHKASVRKVFKGALILSGGYDAARAESDLAAGKADLIAVGRPLLANPDLVERWKTGAPLNAPDMDTFYTPGAKGYTDYPVLAAVPQPA
jgi:N-ethylmaleimide reductase